MKSTTMRMTFRVKVLTPYLTEHLEEGEFRRRQCEKYGYDPNGILGRQVVTQRHRVVIERPRYRGDLRDTAGVDGADLVITGSTVDCEQEVRNMRGSGAIVARYSIFYGGPSEYTGRMPEESGYALDIPKSPGDARALLTDDETLDALLTRDDEKIRAALATLNGRTEAPIIVTPYLSTALKHERR